MNVHTTRFGDVQLPDRALISFPDGLNAFPGLTRFVLLRASELGLFRWLQSVDLPDLAFVVCDPRLILSDYALRVPASLVSDIGITSDEQAELLVMLSHPNDRARMTADLQHPILYNRRPNLARQFSLPAGAFSPCHRVFPEARTAPQPVSA